MGAGITYTFDRLANGIVRIVASDNSYKNYFTIASTIIDTSGDTLAISVTNGANFNLSLAQLGNINGAAPPGDIDAAAVTLMTTVFYTNPDASSGSGTGLRMQFGNWSWFDNGTDALLQHLDSGVWTTKQDQAP